MTDSPETRIIPVTGAGQSAFLPSTDKVYGLGRHVHHDPRSRRYPYRRGAARLEAVHHPRYVPIFDQGELGSCTGNAALGILGTGPYFQALSPSGQANGPQTVAGNRIPWDESGAVHLYSAITAADDFDGAYPPDDTGSDGLSAAKTLTTLGVVPGYEHTFSLADALAALQHFPLLVGTVWTSAMFEPDKFGRILPRGNADGGHEWIVDEYVPPGEWNVNDHVLSTIAAYVGGTTSWGESFGINGRFYLSMFEFGRLLADDGDVIVLTPPSAPPPTPEPDDRDADLLAGLRRLSDSGQILGIFPPA